MRLRAKHTTALCSIAALLAAAALATPAMAGEQLRKVAGGFAVIPESSQPHPENPFLTHTNFQFFSRTGQVTPFNAPGGKFETPASLACIYGLTKKVKGCNPTTLKTVAKGGSKAIAIVDAYDDPTAASDLNVYSQQFGLPAITKDNFQVIYASGKKPRQDATGGWEAEAQLDIEMAHAMAPNAKIILVEAASANLQDILKAEQVAIKAVQAAGGGEVSNSYGSNEYAGEAKLAPSYSGDNVVVFASSGDSPGVSVPAVLTNVISVGGTTISRDSKADYAGESTWNFGGGGLSSYIKVPSYQSGNTAVSAVVGKWRGTPDVSFVANNYSGVWIYDTTPYNGQVLQWATIGGTSVSSPAVAGIFNNAGSFKASTEEELAEIYANGTNKKNYADITIGQCPNDNRGRAQKGFDLCTGVGTPFSKAGK